MPERCKILSDESTAPLVMRLVLKLVRQPTKGICTWDGGNRNCNGCPHARQHTYIRARQLQLPSGATDVTSTITDISAELPADTAGWRAQIGYTGQDGVLHRRHDVLTVTKGIPGLTVGPELNVVTYKI